jgi:MarR-like DNA-binding transcriptional regulator SgrR of sgrS sRNA
MSATEQHYTVPEIAAMWKCSPQTVRRLFQNEADVLKIGSGEGRFKRPYCTLYITETALRRVYARCSKPKKP